MKHYLFSAGLMLTAFTTHAQGVGIGTTQPAATSILELNSTSKGFLMTRMTSTERTNISSPATGLQVYDTTTNTLWYFNGSVWVNGGAASSSGGGDNLGDHLATQPLVLNTNQLRLSTANDSNHKLVYDGNIDGPLLTGFSGGTLGTSDAAGSVSRNVLTWKNTGFVGIGTTTPGSTLEVDGASTNKTAYNAGSGSTIDYSKSNLAYTAASATAFTLQNMKDGGTYTLSVRGATSGTSTFTASGFTVKYASNRATTANTETLYTFIVMGSTIYVYTTTGF